MKSTAPMSDAVRKIVCFGPGPKFKGGIANYNVSLAKALDKIPGLEVHIVSWTQQYPAIVPREFVDKSSKADLLEGTNIKVHYITNYNRPGTWRKTVELIKEIGPEKVVIQWYNAQQGWPLGYIARKLRSVTEVLFDLHFVVPKENSKIDAWFTKLGLRRAQNFIVHALKTHRELEALFPGESFFLSEDGKRSDDGRRTSIKLYHPVYDLFQPDPKFDLSAFKETHGLKKNVFLYFGFIRRYKGLHHVIPAFAELRKRRDDVSLIVCGESFWNTLDNSKFSAKLKNFLFGIAKMLFFKKEDDEKNYRPLDLIDELGISDDVLLVNEFVPNEDVHKYFQASDVGLLFYLTATPSGVESLNYNFKLPVIATSVGHFPETIEDGFNGYLCAPDNIMDMADKMELSLNKPINRDNIAAKTAEFSWDNYAKAILEAPN
jgi:glycosyltransferase involved in cell wall biosynthesis